MGFLNFQDFSTIKKWVFGTGKTKSLDRNHVETNWELQAYFKLIFFRRVQLLQGLLKEGINCGGCGDKTVRLRPGNSESLDHFLDTVEAAYCDHFGIQSDSDQVILKV
jgi:hypothetical protein